MLPAAAERAKADGNLHLFSKKVRPPCPPAPCSTLHVNSAIAAAAPCAHARCMHHAEAPRPERNGLSAGLLLLLLPSPRHISRAPCHGPLLPGPRPQFYEAVRRYSEAIRLAPWAPVLYTNRCWEDRVV